MMGSCSLKLIESFMPEGILFGQHTHNLYIFMKRPWKNSGKVKHDNDDARDGPDFKTWRTCIHTGHNQCNE
ncbi:hypothetical protein ISN45_Aa06g005360 [Arabidopsis thaliana x Arabidopsis arenosa]|uniref:Uncharacterized protein n=1 Tax=Arabidopsis thaliana x Arabidopsis arenosa TaxID=1240361 RepID=A0A8T1YT75_9BRAS|nr:hypothetical protein ISN45_Aa06g005360 [Arabidopsis thaliana x Arabidopsis arenosa]KAG7549675.1 hypothetical protein ISN45_Aa06g005360 [Arabidopsis thaliana x Arabidopsis arenosa]KAG7549676.1 hypothetical protein ISN45_Aa06g005360 [Arabidopsis thaliana x Arabidopsis arenosa]